MDLPLVAFFEKSGAGVTGLTVTVNVIAVPMTSPHTPITVVTNGTATETGLGFYQYFLSTYDLSLYAYFALFTTTGDVDDKVRPSFEMDFALAQATSIAAIKADYARRTGDYATVANQTTIINAVNAIDAGSGTGAFSVAVTVNDGTDALENATVRLTEGANTFTATTDASGIANFSLDGATYAVTITKAGYQFTPATIVVDATHLAFTKSMTAVVIPALADADTAVIYVDTRTESGEVDNIDVTVTLMEDAPLVVAGSYECSFKQSKKSGVADADFPDLTPTSGRVYFKVYPSMSYKFESYACGYSDAQGNAKTVTSPAVGETVNLSTL